MRSHHRPRHAALVAFLFLCGLGFVGAGALLLYVAATPTPDIASFGARKVDQSTKIYDRTGQVLLYDYNRDAKRDVIPLSDISPNAIKATVAIEDSSFYEHGGIRVSSIIRAILADLVPGGPTQGGSTITQQVVKNEILTNQKSVSRKIREWVLAIKLEQKYSKNDILETYLNDIPYGGTLYGIEAAAESYFGIPARDLTLAESAYLAAMIQAPSYYSPYGSHRAELDGRKNLVLDRMHTLGFIGDDEYAGAKSEAVSFSASAQNSIIAPHFVFYVLDQLKATYGQGVLTSGLTVITTLDADLESKTESIVRTYGDTNEKDFGAHNAALVALDPRTGQILAMVGSRDFFNNAIDGQFNASLALRQPGSTMKPFIYALALMKGYTRDTVVFDVPTQFSTLCKPSEITNDDPPCYAPSDFDQRFRGPMTFETALAQSINIPAIKVLYLVGIQNAIDLAERMGLSSLGSADQYGLTLVLGGGEVRLLDLVGAYAAFGNAGVKNAPNGILEVKAADGSVLGRYSPAPEQVLPENIANDISAMLSDAPARVPEYPLNSPLTIPGYDVAVKTGTTNDTRDAWVIGYTPSVALGVWAGNNDNTPMVKSIAGFIAAPLWHEAMSYAVSKYPKTYFGEADPIPPSVPPLLRGEWRVPDASGTSAPHSLLYWTDRESPRGAPPADPAQDPQFAYWEYGLKTFYAAHPEFFSNVMPLPVPLSSGNVY